MLCQKDCETIDQDSRSNSSWPNVSLYGFYAYSDEDDSDCRGFGENRGPRDTSNLRTLAKILNLPSSSFLFYPAN